MSRKPVYCDSGLSATFCSLHGDCTCPRYIGASAPESGDWDIEDPNCPLHSESSDHPRESPAAPFGDPRGYKGLVKGPEDLYWIGLEP
jgi:hypothetical protein